MSDLFVTLDDIALSFLEFFPSVINQRLKLINVISQSLVLIVQSRDISVIALVLNFEVPYLLFDTADLPFLIMLKLLHFLQVINLLFQRLLTLIHLFLTLFDTVSEVLHLPLEVSVYPILLLF